MKEENKDDLFKKLSDILSDIKFYEMRDKHIESQLKILSFLTLPKENNVNVKYNKRMLYDSILIFINAVTFFMYKLCKEEDIEFDNAKNMGIKLANDLKKIIKVYTGIDPADIFESETINDKKDE